MFAGKLGRTTDGGKCLSGSFSGLCLLLVLFFINLILCSTLWPLIFSDIWQYISFISEQDFHFSVWHSLNYAIRMPSSWTVCMHINYIPIAHTCHILCYTHIFINMHIYIFFFISYINIHINTKKQHHYSSLFGSGAVGQVRKEEQRLIWNRCWKQRWALICGVTEREEKLHDFRKRKKQGHERKSCKNKIFYMIMNVTMSNISFSVSLKWMWNIF